MPDPDTGDIVVKGKRLRGGIEVASLPNIWVPSWWIDFTRTDGAFPGGAAPVYGPVFEGPADKVIHIPGTDIDVVIADATWQAMPTNLKKAILGAFANWQNSPDLRSAINHLQQQGVAAIELRYGNTYTDQLTGTVKYWVAPGSKVVVNINTAAYPDKAAQIGHWLYDIAHELWHPIIPEQLDSSGRPIFLSDEAMAQRLFEFAGATYAAFHVESLIADAGGDSDTPIQGASSPSAASAAGMVVIDLDGDGVSLDDPDAAGISIDVGGDGVAERLSGIGPHDGLLVLDRDGDGLLSDFAELSFVGDLRGAATGLEGLLAFDGDRDGLLTPADARLGEFKLRIDVDGDGPSTASEIHGLAELGITSVGLGIAGRQAVDYDFRSASRLAGRPSRGRTARSGRTTLPSASYEM